MQTFPDGGGCVLSCDDKARLINLAFHLEFLNYDEKILNLIFHLFNEPEKRAIYAFWRNLTPVCQRAYLCMKEFEENYV